MKAPEGAITSMKQMIAILKAAKSSESHISLFLVWANHGEKIMTHVVLDKKTTYSVGSDIIRAKCLDLGRDETLCTSLCSFYPVKKGYDWSEPFWYFANYWLAWGYFQRYKESDA